MANVFDLLDAEWRRLDCDRAAARRLPTVCAVAGRAWTLGEVERFVRAADPADADRVLLALVALAVEGDQLAARVLLQLLLPGTRALARRWWALGEPDERAAAAVTAVYHRICHYPLARRPGRVAANVLLDAAQELRRRVPRLITVPAADPAAGRERGAAAAAWAEEAPGREGGAQAPARRRSTDGRAETPNPAVELAELLADAVDAGIVDRDDAELIARSRIAGHRVADIASQRGLRPRTLWDRRQRAESTLVAALAAS
jgi:hypothetical protein